MDNTAFVQNIKILCIKRGIKPTNACKESGVGGSFINDLERGRVPAVNRVQALAAYLGVTTSELLGEDLPRAGPNRTALTDLTAEELGLLAAYRAADDRARQVVDLTLEPWKKSESAEKAM